MKNMRTVTKPRDQIAAEFAAVFQGMKPDRLAVETERLAPYRAEISKLRKRRLTWKQIADGMSRPPISVPVTERLLKSIFAPAPALPITPKAAGK
ncbi:MAG TPA: hypothetical protein VHE61_13805 [Opitutaceae bacterium]|nr:hypothetical protein [Opitutaceae bacterium]